MAESVNPIRPTDDDARSLARDLIRQARTAALAVTDPSTGAPYVSRIAVGLLSGDKLATLISSLSLHTRALLADPRCCVLLGEPGPRGDPLNHPRLSLSATALFLPRGTDEDNEARRAWVAIHPKAKLYVDFGDFLVARLFPGAAALNGGFGKAFSLTPDDLGLV